MINRLLTLNESQKEVVSSHELNEADSDWTGRIEVESNFFFFFF